MQGQMKKLLLGLLVFTLALFSTPVSAEVQLTSGKYHETVEDLRVKVLGGFVIMDRTWYEGRWQFNRRWNPLTLNYDTLDGSLKSIERSGNTYKKMDSGGTVFRFDKRRTIAVTASGFHWQDREGNWIDYDNTGRIIAYGDRNNVRVTLTYDAAGHLSGVLDHHGTQVLWFEYDANGQLTTVRDIANRHVQYQYTTGRLTTVTEVLGNDWRYQYDGQGQLTGKTDAEGRQTTIAYSGTGMVTSIKYPDGAVTSYSYADDSVRKLFQVQVKTAGGRVDEYWYNREGYQVRYDVNGRTVRSLAFDLRKQIVSDELGRETVTEYDEWDNLQKIIYPDGSTVTYEYDRYSNVTRYVNENGVVTLNQYNERGNLISRTDAVGIPVQRITEYTYDNYGQPLTIERPGDAVTAEAVITLTYDTWGNALTNTSPQGYTTKYTYDVMGNILTHTDGRGKIWTYAYDAVGHLLQETNPLAQAFRYEYDKVGNRIKEIDPLNKMTRYEYDGRNNLVRKIDAYGNAAVLAYDADKHLTATTDEEGKVVRLEYGADGNLRKIISSSGDIIHYEYGTDGSNASYSMISVITYPTYRESYQFDRRGRPVNIHKLMGNGGKLTITNNYDKVGNIIVSKDELNRITRIEYNALNRPIIVTDPLGYTVKYAYDNRDNLISITNQRNIVIRRFVYDRDNRLVKEIWPAGESFAYEYDGNNNLIRKIDGKGQIINYIYDAADQKITDRFEANIDPDLPLKIIQYTYDAAGNLSSYDDGATTSAYTYDDLYRKISETINYGPFALNYRYEYYKNGLKKAFINPDEVRIAYTYDTDNRLARIDIPEEGSIVFNRYRWLKPEQITLPGGGQQMYEYDSLLRTARIVARNPVGDPILDYSMSYDAIGNVTQKQTEHGSYTYEYDALDRLLKAQSPVLPLEVFTYDPAGNRLSDSRDNNWSYNDQDQLLSHGDATYRYDANGNLVQKIKNDLSTRYNYNREGGLNTIRNSDNDLIAQYTYDPFSRRISKMVNGQMTYYFYSDEGLIGEYNQTGQIIRNYGHILQSQWNTELLFINHGNGYFYYHNDYLGTPQLLTDKNGVKHWSVTYEAFGKADIQNSTINNNLSFPGQYYDDETELYYNFLRYYDPLLGRYIQSDILGIQGGLNNYSYAYQNPIIYIDPTGEVPWGLILAGGDILLQLYQNGGNWRCVDWTSVGFSMIGGGLLNGLLKGAFKFKTVGSHTWSATRAWMKSRGILPIRPGQHLHHWLFERNQGIGKYIPEWIKNQPWNLNPISGKFNIWLGKRPWLAPLGAPSWAAEIGLGTGMSVTDTIAGDNCGCR